MLLYVTRIEIGKYSILPRIFFNIARTELKNLRWVDWNRNRIYRIQIYHSTFCGINHNKQDESKKPQRNSYDLKLLFHTSYENALVVKHTFGWVHKSITKTFFSFTAKWQKVQIKKYSRNFVNRLFKVVFKKKRIVAVFNKDNLTLGNITW